MILTWWSSGDTAIPPRDLGVEPGGHNVYIPDTSAGSGPLVMDELVRGIQRKRQRREVDILAAFLMMRRK